MKYYVGYKGRNQSIIFRSRHEPTSEKHPINVRFCFGGYNTRREAERVAMYQNYIIQNSWFEDTPLWLGNKDEDME